MSDVELAPDRPAARGLPEAQAVAPDPSALAKKRADQNRRKKKSRRKLKTVQQVEQRFLCSEAESARIVELCTARGGVDGPYELTEYLLTLVRRDWEAWQAQQAALKEVGPCQHCGADLPDGCQGLHKGVTGCYHTARFAAELML